MYFHLNESRIFKILFYDFKNEYITCFQRNNELLFIWLYLQRYASVDL